VFFPTGPALGAGGMPRKPAWLRALRGDAKSFVSFLKNNAEIPKVRGNAAVTSYMKRKKACKRDKAIKKVAENNLKFFCGNPKVPEKAAVTGLDVAKKSRQTNYFFVSGQGFFEEFPPNNFHAARA
jgi:hypothetical protein